MFGILGYIRRMVAEAVVAGGRDGLEQLGFSRSPEDSEAVAGSFRLALAAHDQRETQQATEALPAPEKEAGKEAKTRSRRNAA